MVQQGGTPRMCPFYTTIVFSLVLLDLNCHTIKPVAATCIASPEYATWRTKQATTIRRSLQQVAPAPKIESNVTNRHLILAEHRTARPDPLDHFHVYRQGWDIRNKHYWASVGLTGGPGFVLAAVWLALGLAHLLLLCCCCCCCRDSLKGAHQGGNLFPLLFLLIFTGAAVAGCVLVYTGQGKFYDELSDALDYVVHESEIVVVQLRNVSAALAETQTIDVLNFALPSSDKTQIQQLSAELKSAATDLETQTNENAHRIRHGLNEVRLAMVVVAGVMLLLVLLGFLVSTLGIMPLVYLLVFLGWFMVAGTWILCGVYIVLNNAIGDTCVAMQDWSSNPSAQTSLSEILPCVDVSTTNKTLDQTRRVTNETVMGINSIIATRLNQGSSQPLPLLCNPVEPELSPSGCLNINEAPKEWLSYVCKSSSNQTCPVGGKLTSQIYNQLNQSMNVIESLYNSTPFLLNLANCQFVREVFDTIRERYCGPLRKYSKWIYVGLALISGGCMFSILLWVVFSRRRRHRFFTHAPVAGPGNAQFMTRAGPTMHSKPA